MPGGESFRVLLPQNTLSEFQYFVAQLFGFLKLSLSYVDEHNASHGCNRVWMLNSQNTTPDFHGTIHVLQSHRIITQRMIGETDGHADRSLNARLLFELT